MSLFEFLRGLPPDIAVEIYDPPQYYEVTGEYNPMRVCPEKHYYFRNRFCCPQCGSEEYREVIARDVKKYRRGDYHDCGTVRYEEIIRKTDNPPPPATD